jgi:hypothetical protein
MYYDRDHDHDRDRDRDRDRDPKIVRNPDGCLDLCLTVLLERLLSRMNRN